MSEDTVALSPSEAARLLGASTEVIRSMSTSMTDSALGFHPGPGEWCVKEVLGHLIEAEGRGFAGRIRAILSESNPVLVGWNQEEVARTRGDCARNLDSLLGEFLDLRRSSLNLVSGLKEADLARGGQHPMVGWLTVGDLLQEWIYHDQNHVRQMLANLQNWIWPHMGNARRFYESE